MSTMRGGFWRSLPWFSKALEESEARYRRLFENVPDGVYESSPDGRILAANPALVRMLGFRSEEELCSGNLATQFYVDPFDRERTSRILEQTGELRNEELRLRRKDGIEIIVLENARAIYDGNGRLICYQGTITEITDRKRAEQDLREARDQALEASRLKSHFLANISHELRTPLGGVIGMIDLLADTQLSDDQREAVDAVRRSAQYLLGLINELLDFSEIEAGRLRMLDQPLRIRDVVAGTLELLTEKADKKGLRIVADVESSVPEQLTGDESRLRQVLLNLAGNAVKFTEKGEIRLRVSAPRRVGDDRVDILIEVSDTGIGISKEALPRIWEPFRQADGTTRRRYGGTGLGLSIVREIMNRMGGEAGCESELGAGSRFWVRCPMRVAPDSVLSGTSSDSSAGSLLPLALKTGSVTPNLPRLLIAEDNDVNRLVIRRMVERLGYEVDVAVNGRQALALALGDRCYQAILMDCQMPDMDGFEATAELRRRGSTIPIIAVTAHAIKGDRDVCLAAGMNAYISKPISLDELSAALRKWATPAHAPGVDEKARVAV